MNLQESGHLLYKYVTFLFLIIILVGVLIDGIRNQGERKCIVRHFKFAFRESDLALALLYAGIRSIYIGYYIVEGTIFIIMYFCTILYSSISALGNKPHMIWGNEVEGMYFSSQLLITISLFIGQEPSTLKLTEMGALISIIVKVVGYLFSLLFVGTILDRVNHKENEKIRKKAIRKTCDKILNNISNKTLE